MELDHVVLADMASPRPDGKIDLYGVGWDTIFAPSVPTAHPRMDLVIRFLLTSQEVETSHRVVVALLGADQELSRLQAEVQPMPPEQRAQVEPGRRIGIGLLLTIAGQVFPDYGAYSLAITWDGTEVREAIRLFVAPPPGAPPQS